MRERLHGFPYQLDDNDFARYPYYNDFAQYLWDTGLGKRLQNRRLVCLHLWDRHSVVDPAFRHVSRLESLVKQTAF